MNAKTPIVLRILKCGIAAIAVLNLVALFLFQYTLPDFSLPTIPDPFLLSGDASSGETDSQYFFEFEDDTLTYDGSGTLDLLEGVTLMSPDGALPPDTIYARIRTESASSQKLIEYTADTDGGQISATRKLQLSNYAGPAIHLPAELPTLSDPEDALETLRADEAFYAKDGFDNDITSSISVTYTVDNDDPFLVHYTFSITNSLNDTATADADISLEAKPMITLSEDTVTLSIGESFSPLRYVASAVDANGKSMTNYIGVENPVNTRTPGTYTVTYTIYAPDGSASAPAELTVIVKESPS